MIDSDTHSGIAERYLDFAQQPGYLQLCAIRKQAEAASLSDPFFKCHDGWVGATTTIDGRQYINYASYNYLALSHDERVISAAKESIDRYGTSVGASRSVSGERPVHGELETALACYHGTEDALVFVSGHATNVSTIGYLLGPGDLLIHDKYIHNSSLMGAKLSGARRMSFPHNNLEALEALLKAQRHHYKRALIVVEGLYSMDGDISDIRGLIALKQRYQCWLMVDEAHSLGVLGANGGGLQEHAQIDATDVDIWMGTLSKSLASSGGYIAGVKALVDSLRYFSPGFLYSVGMSPQVAAPALEALRIMQAEPERVHKLHAISQYFLERAKALGFDVGTCTGNAIIPVIIGNSMQAIAISHKMFELGINVQPILHPAVPEQSARLRFFLSCEHTQAQVDKTLNKLFTILQGTSFTHPV